MIPRAFFPFYLSSWEEDDDENSIQHSQSRFLILLPIRRPRPICHLPANLAMLYLGSTYLKK